MHNIKDRQVQYPNRFQLTPVSGQENVYDVVAVPGTITQAGTVLSKANLLSDSTATLLGLSGDPTVNDALQLIGSRAKIETGTYTGTGTAGASNPNTLTFSFAPKLAIVLPYSNASRVGPLLITAGTTQTFIRYTSSGGTSASDATINWSNGGKTVSWYVSSTNASYQLNTNGTNYIYVAFG